MRSIANACGGTPLTTSMIKVAKLQAERAPTKRKIMFTITDGGCQMGFSGVRAAAEYIEAGMDIELANLGIGFTQGAFRNETRVDDTQDVATIGLEKLTMILQAGAR